MEIYQETSPNAQHYLKRPSDNFASSILESVFGGELAAAKSQILSSDTQMTDESKIPDAAIDTTKVLARLESRKEKASVALGIGANEVETLPFDLSALESEGIFLNIDCRGFGALALPWHGACKFATATNTSTAKNI